MKTTNMKTTSAIPPVESTSVRTVGSINPNENAAGEHTHVKTMGVKTMSVKTMSTTQLQMPLKSTSMKTMSAISPHENAHGERKREEDDEREDQERAGRR